MTYIDMGARWAAAVTFVVLVVKMATIARALFVAAAVVGG